MGYSYKSHFLISEDIWKTENHDLQILQAQVKEQGGAEKI